MPNAPQYYAISADAVFAVADQIKTARDTMQTSPVMVKNVEIIRGLTMQKSHPTRSNILAVQELLAEAGLDVEPYLLVIN